MNDKTLSVISPLLYSDFFSFPLTLAEIRTYSQTKGITEAECRIVLTSLHPYVREFQGYYFLEGKKTSVTRRKKGRIHAAKKYRYALRVSRFFARIPSILYVGLSGSVATGSACTEDDIDLFIITRKNTLFVTRLLLIAILLCLGKKRGKHDTKGTDKICLNMLIDESRLAFSSTRHDLYTAREIAQMLPLVDRKGIQERFYRRNTWMKQFLPNCYPNKAVITPGDSRFVAITSLSVWYRIEQIVRKFQLFVMRKHRTTEIVSAGYMAFHPHDYRREIMTAYTEKMQQFRGYMKQKKQRTIRLPVDIDKEKNIFYTA